MTLCCCKSFFFCCSTNVSGFFFLLYTNPNLCFSSSWSPHELSCRMHFISAAGTQVKCSDWFSPGLNTWGYFHALHCSHTELTCGEVTWLYCAGFVLRGRFCLFVSLFFLPVVRCACVFVWNIWGGLDWRERSTQSPHQRGPVFLKRYSGAKRGMFCQIRQSRKIQRFIIRTP